MQQPGDGRPSYDELVAVVGFLKQRFEQLETRVVELEVENAALRAENAALRAENAALRAENAELKAKLGKNSRNSSKPVCHEREGGVGM